MERDSVVIRSVVPYINRPARYGNGQVACKGHINRRLASRRLEGRDIPDVLNMESVAEEEILKFRAMWILIWSI